MLDLANSAAANAPPLTSPDSIAVLERLALEPRQGALIAAWRDYDDSVSVRTRYEIDRELQFLHRIGAPEEARPLLAAQLAGFLELDRDAAIPELDLGDLVRIRALFGEPAHPDALTHGERLIQSGVSARRAYHHVATSLARSGQGALAQVWFRKGDQVGIPHWETMLEALTGDRRRDLLALRWSQDAETMAAIATVAAYESARPDPSDGRTTFDLEVMRAALLGQTYRADIARAAYGALFAHIDRGDLLIDFDYARFGNALRLANDTAGWEATEKALRRWRAEAQEGFDLPHAWALSQFLAGRGDLVGSYAVMDAVVAQLLKTPPNALQKMLYEETAPVLAEDGSLTNDAQLTLLLAAARSTPSMYWSTEQVPGLRERAEALLSRLSGAELRRCVDRDSDVLGLLGSIGLGDSSLAEAAQFGREEFDFVVNGCVDASRFAEAERWLGWAAAMNVDVPTAQSQLERAVAACGSDKDWDRLRACGLSEAASAGYWQVRARRAVWELDLAALGLAASRLGDTAAWTLLQIASERLADFDPEPPVVKTPSQLLNEQFPDLAKCSTSATRVLWILKATREHFGAKAYLVFGMTDGTGVCVATEYDDSFAMCTLSAEATAEETVTRLREAFDVSEDLVSALAFEASMPVALEESYRRFSFNAVTVPSYGVVTATSPSLAEIEAFLDSHGGVPDGGHAWFVHGGIVYAAHGAQGERSFRRYLSADQIEQMLPKVFAMRDRVEKAKATYAKAFESQGALAIDQLVESYRTSQMILLGARQNPASGVWQLGDSGYDGVVDALESYVAAKPIAELR